jgi:glutathione S-transferase
MQYVSVEEARALGGLRLVLTAGVPGPWGESAKAILAHKDIDYVPVYQEAGGANDALQAWTGQNSAPVAILDDEPPRSSWLDLLLLAERLAPEKPLLPDDLEQRALIIGLSRELAGERGLAWNRRLFMIAPLMQLPEPPEMVARMGAKYGWSEAELVLAAGRIQACLEYFTTRMRMQRRLQSDYVVGAEITAVDFYLANFVAMFKPLSHAVNPMPDYMRRSYEDLPESQQAWLSEELLAHRAMMYQRHIALPLDF